MGRKYALDKYGCRLYKSQRPLFIHPDEWRKYSSAKRIEIVKDLESSPPDAAASVPADTDWEKATAHEEHFLADIENACLSYVPEHVLEDMAASESEVRTKRALKHKIKRIKRRARQSYQAAAAMPLEEEVTTFAHRDKRAPSWGLNACVARPVGKKRLRVTLKLRRRRTPSGGDS